jgi:hypothetical protein
MNACAPLTTAGGNLNAIKFSPKMWIIHPMDSLSPVRTTLAFNHSSLTLWSWFGIGLAVADKAEGDESAVVAVLGKRLRRISV